MKKERLLMTENRKQKTCKKHFLSTDYLLLATLILVWLILPQEVAWAEWIPPIGIPKPEFGIEETYRMYDDPANRNPALNYTENTEGGYYTHYVDNTHSSATNTDNPYGTASKPRNTIPTPLTEGSVVEVHGGSYGNNWGDKLMIEGTGTKEKPIFIRGVSELERPVVAGRLYPQGSYMIFENLYLNNAEFINAQFIFNIRYAANLYGPVDHVALRNSELEGSGTISTKHAIGIGSSETEKPNNIVIYNNHIHHFGDSQAIEENEAMGVLVTQTQNVWIVDNHIHHVGGDSVQVNDWGTGNAHHIYIGRNLMHENKENAVDIKESEHVIISENEMYGFWPSPTSPVGTAIVVHYDPVLNIWITHNHIYTSQVGISSVNGPTTLYVTNNIFHNITGNAIQFRENEEVYVVGNTIYDSGGGISGWSNTNYALYMSNNIISDLKAADDIHLSLQSDPAINSMATFNLFYQTGGSPIINWGGFTGYDVSEFISAYPDKSEGCIEADPLFVDAENNDFSLLSGSPAIDNGTLSDVYQTFFDLYGIDIRKDIERRTRPQGSAWDIGAYEYVLFPVSVIKNEPKEGRAPLTVSFDGSQSKSPHGDIVSYEWDFGDGSTSTGMKTSHIFTSAGEYAVTLTVTDDHGWKGKSQTHIIVFEKEFGELPAGCYNNVFNPAKGEKALIVVELPKQAHVRLNLYNTRGNRIRELADEQKEAGTHKYYWDGKSGNGDVVGSGLYFVHIQAGDYKKTKKIVIIK